MKFFSGNGFATLTCLSKTGPKFRLTAFFVGWGARSPSSSRLARQNFGLGRYTHTLLANSPGIPVPRRAGNTADRILGEIQRAFETGFSEFSSQSIILN